MDKELIMNSLSQKKKIVFPKYTKIALIISAVLFVIYAFVKILKEYGTYLYLFGIGSDAIIKILVIVCSAFVVIAATVFLIRNSKHKIIVSIILTVVIGYIALMYFSWFVWTYRGRDSYKEFTSPDKEHTIVIYNESMFFSGGGKIFEKTSFCTMRYVSFWSSDDGIYPFGSNHSYRIVWNEDNCELYYDYGTGSIVHEKIDYTK